MKKILFLAVFCFGLIQSIYSQEQVTYDFNFRLENGKRVLRILNFWESKLGKGIELKGPAFQLMSVRSTGVLTNTVANLQTALKDNGANYCEFTRCLVELPEGLNTSETYILTVDAGGVRFWGTISLKSSAKLLPSKDADRQDSEVLLKSNTPLNITEGGPVELTEDRLIVDQDKMLAVKDPKPPKQNVIIRTVNDSHGENITEATLQLKKKVDIGTTKSFTITNPASLKAATNEASGKITIAGASADPSDPKFSVTLTSETAKRKSHNVLVAGSWTVRRPKFATLFGRFSSCFTETVTAGGEVVKKDQDNNVPMAPDYISEECRGKDLSPVEKFMFGGYKTGARNAMDSSVPSTFFAGLEPKITFDVGSKSSETKNSITGEMPFVFYLGNNKRPILTAADLAAKKVTPAMAKEGVPLYMYGGWKGSGWFDLADVKLSFGPKLVFYKNDDREDVKWYDFDLKNTLITVRADFEFYRWLGTLGEKQKLLKADFTTAGKGDDFYKLKKPGFGWKFVPYLMFEGGRSIHADTIDNTLGGVAQTVVIPRYNITRFKVGGEGRLEWQFGVRIFGITTNYGLLYLSTSEKSSFVTDDLLLLRSVRGYHPHFKTSFDFTLDPAKRFSVTTAWENGLSLPGLEQLNKVSSGITVKY